MCVQKSLFAFISALMLLLFCMPISAKAVDNSVTEVFVSVENTVVAHTAMDNPVKYKIVPEAAKEHATVSISYRAIKSLEDKGVGVAVPKDLGKYLVRIEVSFDTDKYYCAGKYLIYEIAEKQGAPLVGEDALRSVPEEFFATVENISATYSKPYGEPICTLNVASITPRVMYSHLFANGTTSDYTDEPPTEPGDYITSCFVLDTVVGTGRLIIDKLTPQIEMDDKSFTYTPKGVFPDKAAVNPAGIELEYKAYIYKDGVVGNAVELPLTACGTYLISACPADTAHYTFTLSYCYITVNKAIPVITAESLVYTADGKPKPLAFTVAPDFAAYDVSYYKLEGGNALPLDGAPVDKGEYYAVVSVKGSATLESATKVFGIRIVGTESGLQRFFGILLKIICAVTGMAAFALGGSQLYTAWADKERKA